MGPERRGREEQKRDEMVSRVGPVQDILSTDRDFAKPSLDPRVSQDGADERRGASIEIKLILIDLLRRIGS